jgi:PLP dependent protein
VVAEIGEEVEEFAVNPVADRARELQERIAAACARSDRDRASVTLVAASKEQPPEALRAAWEAGVRIFGENRVQEARAKREALPAAAQWHLLGPLQSNKVRAALGLFRCFHALDRVEIATALERRAKELGVEIEGFLEVNLGGEGTKHGFPVPGLAESVRPLAELQALRVVGLMAIPPFEEDPEGSRRWFRRLRELASELAARPEWQGFAGQLSMGMSHDFEVAIEEGATHVRIGTALFGPRPG